MLGVPRRPYDEVSAGLVLTWSTLCSLFKPLVPLWGRQIPYTMMKFAAFENIVNMLYFRVVPKPKSECSKNEQLGVSFAAGYIAGAPLSGLATYAGAKC